jgi:AcrR family transcriptional regulator
MAIHSSSSDMATSRFPGGGGSRRDGAAQDRVIAATLELLGEVGYANLSIEAIAARAGVGKPTIYRWWNNKAHLAYEASCSTAAGVIVPDTGDFATDLRRFVERVADFLWRDEVAAALRGILADPDVSHALQHDRMGPARRHVRAIVAAGVKAGEVHQEVDADALFDLAVGAVMLQALGPTKPPRSRRRATEGTVELLLRAARR